MPLTNLFFLDLTLVNAEFIRFVKDEVLSMSIHRKANLWKTDLNECLCMCCGVTSVYVYIG